jgi:hypothetical protein
MPKGLWAPMGVVDTSTSEGVTFAYDLCLGCLIPHWKGIYEEYIFHFILASTSATF